MRYLLFALVFLVGCESADTYGVRIGDIVTVEKGFYAGCMGTITNYDDWQTSDDEVTLRDITCAKVTMNYLRTKAYNLHKK